MHSPFCVIAHRIFGACRASSFVIGGLALVTATQAQTVFTSPAGYVKLNATAAPSSSTQSFNFVNHALAQKRKSVGEVTAGGTDTITSNGSSWSTDQFAGTEGPHFVLITTGSLEGQIYDIASNSSDTLTLAEGSGDTSGLVGDSFQIYQHNTLGSMFGEDPEGNGVLGGGDAGEADQVMLYDLEAGDFREFYFRNSGDPFTDTDIENDWVEDGNINDSAAQTIIPPYQGFIYARRDTSSPLEVTLFGDVITSAVSVPIIPGFNLVAVPAPVDTNLTLGTSGLRPAEGEAEDLSIHLQAGGDADDAETILIYDKATASYRKYFFRNQGDPFINDIENDWVEDGTDFTTSAADTGLNGGSFFVARKTENPSLNWVFPSVIANTEP